MIKWVYRRESTWTVDGDKPLDATTLNKLGADGWELVAICPRLSQSGSAEYVFKRPRTALDDDGDDE